MHNETILRIRFLRNQSKISKSNMNKIRTYLLDNYSLIVLSERDKQKAVRGDQANDN